MSGNDYGPSRDQVLGWHSQLLRGRRSLPCSRLDCRPCLPNDPLLRGGDQRVAELQVQLDWSSRAVLVSSQRSQCLLHLVSGINPGGNVGSEADVFAKEVFLPRALARAGAV